MTVSGMSGVFANQSFPVNGETLVFGRNSTACNIVFPENVRGISRMHCRIERNGNNCTITDLGSSYGTFVNGMKIQQYTPIILKSGDTIYLGDKANMFAFQNGCENTALSRKNAVTYINKDKSSYRYDGEGRRANGVLIGVAVVAAILIAVVSMFAVSVTQQNKALVQKLYEEENKGIVGNFIDVLEDGIDLIAH